MSFLPSLRMCDRLFVGMPYRIDWICSTVSLLSSTRTCKIPILKCSLNFRTFSFILRTAAVDATFGGFLVRWFWIHRSPACPQFLQRWGEGKERGWRDRLAQTLAISSNESQEVVDIECPWVHGSRDGEKVRLRGTEVACPLPFALVLESGMTGCLSDSSYGSAAHVRVYCPDHSHEL